MIVEAVTTGPFEEICYIVRKDDGSALLFDPGHDADRIAAVLDEHRLKVQGYVCTHAHMDHINALAELHDARPAPVAMHPLDLEWAFDPINSMEPYYPVPRRPAVDSFLRLDSEAEWKLGGFSFRCLHTPGHTPGSCCIHFPDDGILISGDTLFRGSCGRTDLPGGNPRQMKKSLEALKQLPDETKVYPGHGPDTTIGIERADNYFMQ